MPTKIRSYNEPYSNDYLNRVAFPLGGIGTGMLCIEGTGALSHLSLRHRPQVFNEPCVFSALTVKGPSPAARVLEGPVPAWKVFGAPGAANGGGQTTWGLPRFGRVVFETRFPFAVINLDDPSLPVAVKLTAWSPFVPGDSHHSSLPVAALEYQFTNRTGQSLDLVYSFNAFNFMAAGPAGASVQNVDAGFLLNQEGTEEKPFTQGTFCVQTDDPNPVVDCAWFRGKWFDPLSMVWNNVAAGSFRSADPHADGAPSPGASLAVPFTLKPGARHLVTLRFSWYVPRSDIRVGKDPGEKEPACGGGKKSPAKPTYTPWYAAQFKDIRQVARYWQEKYETLRDLSLRFSNCYYEMTLPPEVMEAVAANLTILKSPTVLRQEDGRLWCWEGCCDDAGCCAGSCTHVWNYAQALPHLFPDLERSLRQTEFNENQDERGHQNFRASLPIRPTGHEFHAAADGQLGGILKVYRDWRTSGDTGWLKALWPQVKKSLDYCIATWDPAAKGVLEEPHHNTYDIEFWGPDGMCTSFYLGALKAAVVMGRALDDDVSRYEELLRKGKKYLESELFNGEYFFQQITWENLQSPPPHQAQNIMEDTYSAEARELLKKEGPKYQYGTGCLSDGVLGEWMAAVSGLPPVLDSGKVKKHLASVHKYNLKKDLSAHANPQRTSYALGSEGGLLLCTWPKGGRLSLPFVYSNEVWTGIEYQAAAHMIMLGLVEEGLEVVRTCRDRYDGRVRNPFNEYECGHWYARALASYSLLQALSGVRYDAVEKVLYIKPRLKGDFRSFLATATGYGLAGVRDGKPFFDLRQGKVAIDRVEYQEYQ